MLSSPTSLTECLQEWKDLEKDYQQVQEIHRLYKQKLEDVSKLQNSCLSSIQRQKKRLEQLLASLEECKQNGSLEDISIINGIQNSIKERPNVFFEMEAFLPQKNGLYLSLVLGNVNVTLLNKQAKFSYKDEYEKFKLYLTIILLLFSFTCRFVFQNLFQNQNECSPALLKETTLQIHTTTPSGSINKTTTRSNAFTTAPITQNIKETIENSRQTSCTVLLQLTHSTNTCCIIQTVHKVQNQFPIQAYVVEDNVEHVVFILTVKGICQSAVVPPVGSFEKCKCNGSLSPDIPCNSTDTVNVSCKNGTNIAVPLTEQCNKTPVNSATTSMPPLTANTNDIITTVSTTATINTTVSSTNAEATAEGLLNLTRNASSLNTTQIEQVVTLLESLLTGPTISLGLGNTSINIVSNLINAPPSILASSSNRIIGVVDTVGLKLVVQEQSQSILSPSVALAVKPVDGAFFPETTFTINNATNFQIGPRLGKSEPSSPQGSITLPASLTENLDPQQQKLASRVQFNYYQNGILFQDLSRTGITNRLQATILTYITYIGCGISAIFLSITLMTYLAFETLRKDIPSKIVVHLCLALLLLNLTFLLDAWLALYPNIVGLCISTAFFLHFFLLASFSWMAMEAVHMYIALVKVFNTYVSCFMVKLGLAGWGIPVIVVIIVIAIDENNYGLVSYGKFEDGTSDQFCWLKNDTAFYVAVVAYFCVVFILNLSMFIVVMVQLCRIKRQNPHNLQHRNVLQDLRSVAGLTVLLGLTWAFAFFAWDPVNLPFMYLFAIFNSLQGSPFDDCAIREESTESSSDVVLNDINNRHWSQKSL
ncbi:Adhesion G-protein coupled receptor G2 [Bagarius yarrelli]|uniref:Adhesion G-protein coupled receptor G2 n=1 Tax=Bagarius yarrelli TaxID=175774 RepID=A0A556VCB2_BAGYA|nr:Adhesion G-protein coupled receptor G2 [Bagarius yarrelli]